MPGTDLGFQRIHRRQPRAGLGCGAPTHQDPRQMLCPLHLSPALTSHCQVPGPLGILQLASLYLQTPVMQE